MGDPYVRFALGEKADDACNAASPHLIPASPTRYAPDKYSALDFGRPTIRQLISIAANGESQLSESINPTLD